MKRTAWLPVLIATTALLGCGDDPVVGPAGEPVAEGIFAPLGDPISSATPAQRAMFDRGREVALRRFEPGAGLGPQFNSTSCGGCHEKPVLGGAAGRYRDFLLARRTVPGGAFAPGESRVQPQYTLAAGGRAASLEGTVVVATRHAVPLFGAGLLAEIPEEEILARADPNDDDHDGISGRANVESGFVGRFGRKAQFASVEAFLRNELVQHLGLTSDPVPAGRARELPVREAAPEAVANTDDDGAADPELSTDDLVDLVGFTMLLAAPEPDAAAPEAGAGSAIFGAAGCGGCHVPALRAPRGLIPAYTDLLLHDMGAALADEIESGVATGAELRTQPLWGIAAAGPYLHDGRADTVESAILLHGGEAAPARDAYAALDAGDRALLLGFLESLGGASQATEGLLPPGAAVPAPGELGGPATALDAAAMDRFARGRAAFDRDASIAGGLGGRFNGDACRACHSDPVIGGAGPTDVDVTRQAILDPATGEVTLPAAGSMLHRHANGGERPAADPAANLFELRQTPPLFGLGLIEQVAELEISSREDPDDADGDGISGRAHRLPDGRLGRFGWKANVPSLREFARDAMANELGVTVAPEAEQTFGAIEDDDGAADPELREDDLTALVFFMQSLGPPPRTSKDPASESRGEQTFSELGCAGCHVAALPATGGAEVRLYSDLLLHDVAPAGAAGIPAGEADGRELRTPPLWGLHGSAPFMHDGRSFTVADAILRHDSEARAARDAYARLGEQQRAEVEAFLDSL